METTFTDIVKKLVAEQGKETLLNQSKCKSFLADYAKGEYKKYMSMKHWGNITH
jgi:hypothetical protein